MKKIKLFIFFFILLIPLYKVSAGDMCEYKIYSYDDDRYLTTVFVEFNSDNTKIENTTHYDLDEKKQVKFSLSNYTNYKGYKSSEGRNLMLGEFGNYVDQYKETGVCPDIYTYINIADMSYDVLGLDYNVDYSGYNYTTSKAISSNNNNVNNIKELECNYKFGSQIGISTKNNHLKLNMDIKKVSNAGTNYYDIHFSDPDSKFQKNFNLIGEDNWPTQFSFGKSSYSSGNNMTVKISEITIAAIFDKDKCLSQDKIYSYFNLDSNDGWELIITSDYDEAKSSGERIYVGNSTIDNDKENNKQKVENCEVIPDAVEEYIVEALKLIRWGGLALMIVLGVLDFVKAAAADDQDALKKAWQSFIKRLIAVIILFLLPMIVEILMEFINSNFGIKQCM